MTSPTTDALLRAANDRALLVRLRDRAALVVSGNDRSSWLNGLVTCDLAKLGDDRGAYGLLVEKKGKIQTDFYIAQGAGHDSGHPPSAGRPGALALAVPASLRDGVAATLDHYLVMEDAELAPAELAFFLLQGPRSREIANAASQLASFRGALDLFGAGGEVVAGPDGDALEAALVAAGATLADDAGWDAVRIRRGLPRFGVEFDASFYPQEASIEGLAVSFDKGCYLGQEVVYMLQNRGHVKKRLVALDVDGVEPLARGAEITTASGDVVGDVRSSVAAGTATAAIAMVKHAQSKPGQELRAAGRPARVRA